MQMKKKLNLNHYLNHLPQPKNMCKANQRHDKGWLKLKRSSNEEEIDLTQ